MARRTTQFLPGIAQDLRYAIRALRRAPGYVAITVAMLAMGTGASTAVFSIVDGVLLRSPFVDADSVAFALARTPEGRRTSAVPRDAYDRLAANPPPPVAAMGIVTVGSPVVTGVDTPRRTQTECLSASMADVLGTRPQMGRWFAAGEDRPGAPGVAVVSAKFWRGTLGGDPGVIGRTMALDGVPVTIIGVMPPGFDGPFSRINRDIWVPLGQVTTAVPLFGCRAPGDTVNAAVRLKPGMTMEAGLAAFGTVGLLLVPIAEGTVGDLRDPFAALVGAVIAVLLIAFANVANLGLERLIGRRRELAIRLALGATRARIIRETVLEHVLVAAAGAAAGMAGAALAFEAVIALLPPSLPNLDAVSINVRVLAASVGLALLGGLGAGLVSAIQASGASVRVGLTGGDRGHTPGSHTIRRVLVVSELALGVLLLAGALLMIQTFMTLRPSAPGFDPTNKQIALVRLPPAMTHGERVRFVDAVRGELAAVPGVRAVAGTTYVPMSRSVAMLDLVVGDDKGTVFAGTVTTDYFDVMRIPVLRGRTFEDADHPGARPVAVVNEAFVRRWLPGREPLGQTVTLDGGGLSAAPLTIVGVVGDTRWVWSDTRARPEVYLPMAQTLMGSPYFIVSADARSSTIWPATMREIVSRLRPGQLVDRIESFAGMLRSEMARPRLGAWLFGVFAGLAVLLGAVGLAATLAWSVAQRRREIGIRMALGAQPGDVGGLVLRQTFWLAVAGVTTGLLAASASTRLLEGWLYGVTPLDPTTFAACGVVMLAVSGLAAYLPTRRAARIDPVVALRED